MRRRTQLYLDEDQYRWLKRRAGRRGSIAGVVRALIDEARANAPAPAGDPFLQFLLEAPAPKGKQRTSVSDLDRDLYG